MYGPLDAGLSYQGSAGNPGDGTWWYSITDEAGTPLPIFFDSTTDAICGSCEPLNGDPIGAFCGPLGEAGVSAGWNGTTLGGASQCEAPADSGLSGSVVQCQPLRCAPAGRYAAKMCASVECNDPPICVTVPFDFPTSSPVVGHVAP
jgi:hypothetical protein